MLTSTLSAEERIELIRRAIEIYRAMPGDVDILVSFIEAQCIKIRAGV